MKVHHKTREAISEIREFEVCAHCKLMLGEGVPSREFMIHANVDENGIIYGAGDEWGRFNDFESAWEAARGLYEWFKYDYNPGIDTDVCILIHTEGYVSEGAWDEVCEPCLFATFATR